jgi:hypothetical protein
MSDEIERVWKEVVCAWSIYYPSTFMTRLRKSQNTSVRIGGVLVKI